jgi:predicted O-methyltransferase YrrM
MESLTTGLVAEILARLHREAEDTDQPMFDLYREEGEHDDDDNYKGDDYKEAYQKLAGNFLSISPELGRFIYACARARGAKRIVEFGLSFGISAIYLACALRDNGGGRLITTEFLPDKAARARENLMSAGLADLVYIRVGNALETLKDGAGGEVDLALLDAAPYLCLPVLKLLEPSLKEGALVISDNADSTDYIKYVRNPRNGYLSQPLSFDGEDNKEFSLVVR